MPGTIKPNVLEYSRHCAQDICRIMNDLHILSDSALNALYAETFSTSVFRVLSQDVLTLGLGQE